MKSLKNQSNNLAEASPGWLFSAFPPLHSPTGKDLSFFSFSSFSSHVSLERGIYLMLLGLVKHLPTPASAPCSFLLGAFLPHPCWTPDPWETTHLPSSLTPPLSPQGAPHHHYHRPFLSKYSSTAACTCDIGHLLLSTLLPWPRGLWSRRLRQRSAFPKHDFFFSF